MSVIRISLGRMDNPESIRDLLNSNAAAFIGALDLDIRHLVRKPRIETPRITEVVCGPDHSVTLFYEFSWSAFQACQDQHDSGQVRSSIRGLLIDGWLELPTATGTPERTTADEF